MAWTGCAGQSSGGTYVPAASRGGKRVILVDVCGGTAQQGEEMPAWWLECALASAEQQTSLCVPGGVSEVQRAGHSIPLAITLKGRPCCVWEQRQHVLPSMLQRLFSEDRSRSPRLGTRRTMLQVILVLAEGQEAGSGQGVAVNVGEQSECGCILKVEQTRCFSE